ncbi:MAG: alpha-glucuronidase, partial [Paludibacter sp.]|nr:alpha-glucuronidase [Paludibacter sp.]
MSKYILYIVTLLLISSVVLAEDGSRLWLRAETQSVAKVSSNRKSPTIEIAMQELTTQWKGAPIMLMLNKTRKNNPWGSEGYSIKGNVDEGVTISASADIGLLYGAYHLLRLQEAELIENQIDITEKPAYDIRVLNHWDNLDGTVERGYAGHSLWKWDELPDILSPRYKAYARANASIGINGTVLNNVNASPEILTNTYLKKVKILADVFRPYGVRVYLSVNFSSPKIIGGLSDSDPMNPEVKQWWKNKVKAIYRQIPDFGGFLVKANSEGQPGPQDYGCTHADGA